eukprot:356995-Chlamydomonas_euryale.AAC.13
MHAAPLNTSSSSRTMAASRAVRRVRRGKARELGHSSEQERVQEFARVWGDAAVHTATTGAGSQPQL